MSQKPQQSTSEMKSVLWLVTIGEEGSRHVMVKHRTGLFLTCPRDYFPCYPAVRKLFEAHLQSAKLTKDTIHQFDQWSVIANKANCLHQKDSRKLYWERTDPYKYQKLLSTWTTNLSNISNNKTIAASTRIVLRHLSY